MPGAKDTMVNNIDMVPHEASRSAQYCITRLSLWFMSLDGAIELDEFDDIDSYLGEKFILLIWMFKH